jgi:hypothetical protein
MKLDVNKLFFSPQVIRTFRIKYRRFRFRPALLRSVKREIKAGKIATIYWQLAEEGGIRVMIDEYKGVLIFIKAICAKPL